MGRITTGWGGVYCAYAHVRRMEGEVRKKNSCTPGPAHLGDREGSLFSVPPSLCIEVYWSAGSTLEHWEDLNGLMNNRAASELIVVPLLFGQVEGGGVGGT